MRGSDGEGREQQLESAGRRGLPGQDEPKEQLRGIDAYQGAYEAPFSVGFRRVLMSRFFGPAVGS